MSFKSAWARTREEKEGLIGKIESNIRHFPTTLNQRLSNSFNRESYFGHYLELLNFEGKEQNRFIEECPALKAVYQRLSSELNVETFVGEWFDVTQDRINQFAAVTEDDQWIHTDPERAAKESPFKTTIAHGFLTLALIPKLTKSTDSDTGLYPEAKAVVNRGLNSVVYPYPIKVGKKVRARSRITKLVAMKNGLEFVKEVKVEIEKISRPACIAEVVIRLYF